jgi:hypothetical protein
LKYISSSSRVAVAGVLAFVLLNPPFFEIFNRFPAGNIPGWWAGIMWVWAAMIVAIFIGSGKNDKPRNAE